MKCLPRASTVRCAFCHDALSSPAWSCDRCRTRLHEDCRDLAGVCPSLGCEPRRPRVVSVARGASFAHLGVWLATFLNVWATLVWGVSQFFFLTHKRRIVPAPMALLETLSRFARSALGLAIAAFVVVASIVVFVKFGRRPATRRALVGLTASGLIFFPVALVIIVS